MDWITQAVKAIANAPMSTILVLAGVVFLFVAVGGRIVIKNIDIQIEPKVGGRIASGVVGLLLIAFGLFNVTSNSSAKEDNHTPSNEKYNSSSCAQSASDLFSSTKSIRTNAQSYLLASCEDNQSDVELVVDIALANASKAAFDGKKEGIYDVLPYLKNFPESKITNPSIRAKIRKYAEEAKPNSNDSRIVADELMDKYK